MKKLIIALIVIMGIAYSAQAQNLKEMIVFSTDCPNCYGLMDYIEQELKPTYPDLQITVLKLTQDDNMEIFRKCVKEFNVGKGRVGVPLVFIGDKQFIGWSDKIKTDLNEAVKSYLNQNMTTRNEARMKCLM